MQFQQDTDVCTSIKNTKKLLSNTNTFTELHTVKYASVLSVLKSTNYRNFF